MAPRSDELMQLVAIRTDAGPRVAVRRDGRLFDLGAGDIGTVIGSVDMHGGGAEVGAAELLAPLAPGKIVGIGLNYRRHVEETGRPTPEAPVVFAKWPSSVVGSGAEILIDPELTAEVDWEGELAVIVGAPLRHATEAEAMSAVFGYTIANDVTARDVQRADGQWTRAKSFETFCPLGPAVVTRDELGDPADLVIRTRLNGTVVQEASTSDMIFNVAQLLSFCSRCFPLLPGDVLLTGTPWGCGAFMDPPRWLADGDEMEVEIAGIGVLRNPVAVRVATSEGARRVVA